MHLLQVFIVHLLLDTLATLVLHGLLFLGTLFAFLNSFQCDMYGFSLWRWFDEEDREVIYRGYIADGLLIVNSAPTFISF